MNLIDPAELSGLLDREMTEKRSEEIRQLMADTARLREELDALAGADSRWRAAARSAAFPVEIRLPRQKLFAVSTAQATALMMCLLAIRFLPKLANTLTLGLVLNGLALAMVIAWVVAMMRIPEPETSASA